ncbi:YccF domain-containing protein [Parabacteroides pacaensis]|uniref:YccF domain-containing protein n=1 Tax=Parabacteroides pacaensis TaxID=2086575 RepID=UPI000D0E5AB3|nr:YccF domain-containing protein [Parabacteroides pacaensis]
MKTLGNIIWLLFGGIITCIEYLIASIGLMITIIGIPFGLQTFKLATLALWPFGKQVQDTGSSGGCLTVIMNIIWIFIGGIWICLSHLGFGLLLCITIIGIPFGLQHFKLAGLALTPFGKTIVG